QGRFLNRVSQVRFLPGAPCADAARRRLGQRVRSVTCRDPHFGVVTPGVGYATTWSHSDPTPGLAVGVQGQAGGAGQVGYSFGKGGSSFEEVEGGWAPGVSGTIYYVLPGQCEPLPLG